MKLSFRPLRETDLTFLIAVRNECCDFLHDNRKFSLEDAKKWFTECNPKFFIADVDKVSAGYFRTSNWDLINKNIYIGMDLHKDFRGRGLATKFYTIFIDHLFSTYNFRKIKLEVLSNNHRAIHLYNNLGFVTEGVLKDDVLHNGIFYDSIIMSLFIENWKNTIIRDSC